MTAESRQIVATSEDGWQMLYYPSIEDAARNLGLDAGEIEKHLQKRKPKKVGGWTFKYEEPEKNSNEGDK